MLQAVVGSLDQAFGLAGLAKTPWRAQAGLSETPAASGRTEKTGSDLAFDRLTSDRSPGLFVMLWGVRGTIPSGATMLLSCR